MLGSLYDCKLMCNSMYVHVCLYMIIHLYINIYIYIYIHVYIWQPDSGGPGSPGSSFWVAGASVFALGLGRKANLALTGRPGGRPAGRAAGWASKRKMNGGKNPKRKQLSEAINMTGPVQSCFRAFPVYI